MFRYQLKSAFRYFLKQRVFISINILGLVIAFAVSTLIMLYVINEFTYDMQYKNRGYIYRVLSKQQSIGTTYAVVTLDVGPLVKETFPEVDKMSRLIENRSSIVKSEEEINAVSAFVDPDFLEMFAVKGNQDLSQGLLSDQNSVVISEEMAQTVFGDEYPVGKTLHIKFPQGKENFFKVTGVLEKAGKFSSVYGSLFMNFEYYQKNLCDAFIASYPYFTTFLMVPPGTDIPFLEEKINKANKTDWTGISTTKYELQKYSRMYLHSDHLANNRYFTGNAKILYGLLFLVILVVIMACLNFGILSTACALTRNKEVGIKKINGATLQQVKHQIMLESFLQVIIALPFALVLAWVLLPWFNHFVGRELSFNLSDNIVFVAGIILLSLLTALTAGLITSATSVKISPVQLLRKGTRKFGFGMNLNRALLTCQMVVVIWFLSITFIIQKQIRFSTSAGLGYNAENLLVCNITNPNYKSDFYNPKYEDAAKLEDLKTRLINLPAIEGVSMIGEAPPLADQLSSGVIVIPETQKTFTIATLACNANFPEFLGYRLKEGEFFSKDYLGNNSKEIMLNEAAINYIGLENPVGQIVDMDGFKGVKIVGVLYDFNFQSMRKKVVPVRVRKTDNFLRRFDLAVRYAPNMRIVATEQVNTVFNELYPGYESNITYHEDKLKALYEKETSEARIFVFGIVLAVFIAMMGIFGISLFTVRQQVKEIGVRKINGATVAEILTMLNMGIVKWIGIAIVVSTPLAWFFANKWLKTFAYKTNLSWWIFALAGLLALGIALLTVSCQSWRAATRNPVEALRYE